MNLTGKPLVVNLDDARILPIKNAPSAYESFTVRRCRRFVIFEFDSTAYYGVRNENEIELVRAAGSAIPGHYLRRLRDDYRNCEIVMKSKLRSADAEIWENRLHTIAREIESLITPAIDPKP